MVKKSLVFIAAIFIFALPIVSLAAEFGTGQTYSLPKDKTVSQNLYAAGGTVTVSGRVIGDFTSAGGNILFSGSVSGGLVAAGGTVNVLGPVGASARVVGGTVNVNAPVSGDVMVFGGTVNIGPDSSVGGDVIVFGGNVSVDGAVTGNIRAWGGNISINGPVNGGAYIKGDNVSIGDKAVISGNLEYSSPAAAKVSLSAKIKGKTVYTEYKAPANRVWLWGAIGAWAILKLGMLLVLALFMTLVFKRFSHEVVLSTLQNFISKIGAGFVILIVVPAAAVLLFMTVLGIPIAALLMFSYLFSVILSSLFGAVALGAWISKKFFKSPVYRADAKAAVLGALVYWISAFIPVLGWMVRFAFFLAALGAMGILWKERVWTSRI